MGDMTSAELADVHSFIFHTRVTAVSQVLREPEPWRAQEQLHLIAQGWAGGTRIGESIAPGYAPVSQGMAAALPHLDLLGPGADLSSIAPVLPQLIEALR